MGVIFTETGTITNSQAVTMDCSGDIGTVTARITGTWTGNLEFQGTIDSTNWFSISGSDIQFLDGQIPVQTTTNMTPSFNTSGLAKIRIIGATVISGTAQIDMVGSSGNGIITAIQATTFVAQSGVWTVQPGNTPNTTPWLVKDTADGSVTPGTVATNSQLMGGQFNTTLPTLTNTQQSAVQLDSRGRLLASNVPLQGVAQTYSAASLVTSAALATDIFSITGSATKTIAIVSLTISGIATAATVSTVNIIKRSTANTGGTPTTITNVPSDSTNAAATATVVSYAGVPTTGTPVGNIRTIKIFLPPPTGGNANTPSMPIIGPQSFSQPVVLRGTGQVLSLNLAGVTIAGAVLACSVEWIEY